MIRFLTSGESHGKCLTAIVEGFPSNIPITEEYINFHLKRRQQGYGRGLRMKIESDTVEILSGVRFGRTMGFPIALKIENKDWKNWTKIMSIDEKDKKGVEKITIPRPSHADLNGTLKYNFDDIRNSIERSSARETAARVAACSIARRFLEEFNIKVGSFVESIGGIYPSESFFKKLVNNDYEGNIDAWEIAKKADENETRTLDPEQHEKIIDKIKIAKKKGDTLGGVFVVIATGAPIGLGSYAHYDRKLSSDLAASIMSINAVKGVEIGLGFELANLFGSEAHDEIIIKNNSFSRKTNKSGGIEGGITTGLPLIIRGAMKPIATLMSPIDTIDLKSMSDIEAHRERSDFVAVPACAVIAESMTAWSLAKFVLEKFGGDSLEETKKNYYNWIIDLNEIQKKFKDEND